LDLERIVLGAGVAFWLLAVPLWLLRKWPIRKPWSGLLAGWFVLVPAGLALVQLHQRGGPWLLLAAMAPVWVADIAAYFVGRAIGRHKLAPGISPGKSWEGAIGGVLGVVIYGFVLAYAAPQLGLLSSGALLALGVFAVSLVLLAAVSIIGDLFESLAKRQAGVKDSGRLLPGHGGLLDRIDSLTSTLPLVGLAIALWRP
jgi:phosphatidate cytidylyltransferase